MSRHDDHLLVSIKTFGISGNQTKFKMICLVLFNELDVYSAKFYIGYKI
jgi:hypothetical protein